MRAGVTLMFAFAGLVGVVGLSAAGGSLMDEVLGRWFRLREFLATRHPVDNTPPPWAVDNLRRVVVTVLDPLREALGRPIRVTSGFRSDELNRLVDGAPRSQHTRGEAVDFKVDGMPSSEVATRLVRLGVPFDQVIWYDPSRGGHVHVSLRSAGNRGEVLHAPAGGGYVAWSPAGVA